MAIKHSLNTFVKTTLMSCASIPLVVIPLYYINIDRDLILKISTLVAAMSSIYLYLKNYNFFGFKYNADAAAVATRSIGSFDSFFRSTDLHMFGAISSKTQSDDLIDSQTLEKIAAKIYKSSEK